MRDYIKERAIKHGRLFLERDATIRSMAENTVCCASTIHLDLSVRLPQVHSELAKKVREKLDENKEYAALKGGLKTQEKSINRKLRKEKRENG